MAPRRNDTSKAPVADWVVVVASQESRGQRCKEENEEELFHFARRISGQLAVCLSGRIPEFLAWPPSDFALQNCCNVGQTL